MGLQAPVKEAKVSNVYRKNKKGVIEIVEPNRDEYGEIPQGYYRLRLVGISEPFELVSEQYGASTKINMEWKVVASHTPAGRGSVGVKFTDMVNFTISERSNLGKLLVALTGEPLVTGSSFELTDCIDMELEVTVVPDTKKNKSGNTVTYCNLAYDTAVAVGADDEEEAAPPPKKKGVAKAVEANPFNEDEEEDA